MFEFNRLDKTAAPFTGPPYCGGQSKMSSISDRLRPALDLQKCAEALNWTAPEPVSNQVAGELVYPPHVVALIGVDKRWRELGRLALQHFRPATECVYFIGAEEGPIKIGRSAAPLERLFAFQIGSPVRLSILALTPGGSTLESEYHVRFRSLRSHGEWFHRHPDILGEIERLKAA